MVLDSDATVSDPDLTGTNYAGASLTLARSGGAQAEDVFGGTGGVDDVLVTVGGTIPHDDIVPLKELGVAEVFTPGAPTQAIIDFIRTAVADSPRRGE